MYWEVGLYIGYGSGQITVHPYQLAQSNYASAIELAIEIARNEHPNETINFKYVKVYEICH